MLQRMVPGASMLAGLSPRRVGTLALRGTLVVAVLDQVVRRILIARHAGGPEVEDLLAHGLNAEVFPGFLVEAIGGAAAHSVRQAISWAELAAVLVVAAMALSRALYFARLRSQQQRGRAALRGKGKLYRLAVGGTGTEPITTMADVFTILHSYLAVDATQIQRGGGASLAFEFVSNQVMSSPPGGKPSPQHGIGVYLWAPHVPESGKDVLALALQQIKAKYPLVEETEIDPEGAVYAFREGAVLGVQRLTPGSNEYPLKGDGRADLLPSLLNAIVTNPEPNEVNLAGIQIVVRAVTDDVWKGPGEAMVAQLQAMVAAPMKDVPARTVTAQRTAVAPVEARIAQPGYQTIVHIFAHAEGGGAGGPGGPGGPGGSEGPQKAQAAVALYLSKVAAALKIVDGDKNRLVPVGGAQTAVLRRVAPGDAGAVARVAWPDRLRARALGLLPGRLAALAGGTAPADPERDAAPDGRVWAAESRTVLDTVRYREFPDLLPAPFATHIGVMTPSELTGIYHLPGRSVNVFGLIGAGAKRLAAPATVSHAEAAVPERITLGQEPTRRNLSIGVVERRTHMHILGPTGCGKSTLLLNMILQDIEAGRGVAVIEPKGDLIRDIILRLPPEREEDVLYFRAEERFNPIGFNVLQRRPEDEAMGDLIISQMIDNIMAVVGTPAPRAIRYLERAIKAVMDTTSKPSLNHVDRFFNNEDYRLQIVESIRDPDLQQEWNDILQAKSQSKLAEEFDAPRTRLAKFTGNVYARNIVAQPESTFDPRQIMDKGGIFLAHIPTIRPIGGPLARFLGQMILSRFIGAAFTRNDVPEDQRPDFPMYIDEFQNYIIPDLKDVLEMGRSYHFSLIMSHQYISQVEEDGIMDSILGNVRNNIIFNLEEKDAGIFERVFGHVTERADFRKLERYNAYVRLNQADGVKGPYSIKTYGPPPLRD